MKTLQKFVLLLRRSAAARTVTWVSTILLAIFLSSVIGKNVIRKPVINSVTPTVGSPGDQMTISGAGFGSTKGTSYVEIAGSKISSSGYIEWTDNKIVLLLPSNVQDGLIIVGTSAGRSDPDFFANENSIPQTVRTDPLTTFPVITEITQKTNIGELCVINGKNFGHARGGSKVFFTANREDINTEQSTENTFICASEEEFDYVLWSDSEIHVRVPDGAASGSVYIETDRGVSAPQKINIDFPYGKKALNHKRTYVVQLTAEIMSSAPGQEDSITLYIPRPPVSYYQPHSELNEFSPEPLIKDDPKNIIHQKQLSSLINNKQRFNQNFVINVYSVSSNIKPQNITGYKDSRRILYTNFTAADNCVPSENPGITTLAQLIVGKERNPYKQARLIYDYILNHYELEPKTKTSDSSILDLPKNKSGDAYDFAILFTALCRNLGIPAVPVSGILVENNSQTRNHWWSEIYFENYGWFPVDVALAAGLEFQTFINIENKTQFYFGNLDNQHIIFSRGWNQIKPSLFNSKIVPRVRTYALQSVWEESSSNAANYNSLWNNPVILGIY